jgi:hypothetical protein
MRPHPRHIDGCAGGSRPPLDVQRLALWLRPRGPSVGATGTLDTQAHLPATPLLAVTMNEFSILYAVPIGAVAILWATLAVG